MKLKPFIIYAGIIILIPSIDSLFFSEKLFSIFAFPFAFGLGFSEATAYTITYLVYAVIASIIYSTIEDR
jgi:hypothetical protein